MDLRIGKSRIMTLVNPDSVRVESNLKNVIEGRTWEQKKSQDCVVNFIWTILYSSKIVR